MTRGGNYNPKGRVLIFGEKAENWTIKVYSWEKPLIKEFLKQNREKRLKEHKPNNDLGYKA